MERSLLDEAYRKLKGSVYYDKTLAYLRSDIVSFENNSFNSSMKDLLDAINNVDKWKELEIRILNSIKAYTFPKDLSSDFDEKQEAVVISNVISRKISVNKYNNFIDISVEGHIIGVLWILLVGYKIDKDLYENCLGNRLYDSLIFPNSTVSESPNLFKPYFNQYETWRNKGLEIAKNIVDKQDQSVIITMLDLTRYYYNINLTKTKFDRITQTEKESFEVIRINSLIYKIFNKYSSLLGEKSKTILPIGFLPSNIIANAYLCNLDIKLNGLKGAVYYGRYVDDMILVTSVENQSSLYSRVIDKGIDEVVSYMLDQLRNEQILDVRDDNISVIGYEDLIVQKDKFRFFYVDKNGCDTIIEKIKNDISRNTSEFNFIPENAVSELNEDILHFDRVDTVNKLRSINNVSLDKYALSKAIGRNVMMSKYAENYAVSRFLRNINQILNYKEIISNYNQWESILNFYVINKRWEFIYEFSAKVILAINELDEDTNKTKIYTYLNNDNIYSVGDSLIKFYISCFTRSMSIVWGKEIREVILKIDTLFSNITKYTYFREYSRLKNINNMRRRYCNSRMINRNLLPITIEECMTAFAPTDETDNVICFNQLDEYFKAVGQHKYSTAKSKYRPYIISPFDLLYTQLIKEIKNNEPLSNEEFSIKYLLNSYAKNFNNTKRTFLNDCISVDNPDDNNFIISIESNKTITDSGNCRVAVANVNMNKDDFISILDNKPRNITQRCKEISKIINEAIAYKANILVFPEAYIPGAFLPIIQAQVAKHNMIIIGGVEHIVNGNCVYNLTVTLVPIINQFASYAIPFFHKKIYYAPEEEEEIVKRGLIPVTGNGHTLFKVNGLSFLTYCCFELTSIEQRCKFKRDADVVFGVSWNNDVNYYSNIFESLCRDRCCYCVHSNIASAGDSRIVQPKKTASMNIARIKGGINGAVIIDDIDIHALRNHKNHPGSDFKPLPGGY